ncbi:hypothetical protein DFQ03_0275 [Maribacter caenipelagi]|uniref:Uncharacterized protein n=1 Tax=Maribacter caenipelagi TaxID=1447781 RepID=A0A4R7DDN2_9FLAO|nr:hypothetical protein DFQ03_0275 [Maribacter caenipelagi]
MTKQPEALLEHKLIHLIIEVYWKLGYNYSKPL